MYVPGSWALILAPEQMLSFILLNWELFLLITEAKGDLLKGTKMIHKPEGTMNTGI